MTKTTKKDILKLWLTIEIVIVFVTCVHLGPEGLAREFCNYLPNDKCDEIEWSKE